MRPSRRANDDADVDSHANADGDVHADEHPH